jgi:spermidine/putrescine transport system substrate-binding protein
VRGSYASSAERVRCDNGAVQTSRRDFLIGSFALLSAAGCGIGNGSNTGVENIGPAAAVGKQVLDGDLSLAVPKDALPKAVVSSFHESTGVNVGVQRVATDEELLLGVGAGAAGFLDAVLVGHVVLDQLIERKLVEPLDRSLIPGRDGIEAPYDDPPGDGGLRHGIPQDVTPVGFGVLETAPIREDSWAGFFALAREYPGRVDVPDDADVVIGAMLVALGHRWNSDNDGELDDAEAALRKLRPALNIRPEPRHVGPAGAMAALSPGTAYRGAQSPVRFVVPAEETAVRVRSWCIPILAPHPVSAHAWLANAIDPVTAAEWTMQTGRATPVEGARSRLPTMLADDPAVYPPANAVGNLVYEQLSPDGRLRREQIWQGVTA